MNRREFLRATGGLAALGPGADWQGISLAAGGETVEAGSTLSSWQPGFLDIHHINTGRGNSALVLMPDGTSLLIDAGASGTRGAAMNPARPDGSRRPGQWIARYIQRQLKAAPKIDLDYALLTHLHGDHIGDVNSESPGSTYGGYKLTGISDVAEVMPIGKLIDRGYPDYNYPSAVTDATASNYIQFSRTVVRRGLAVEGIKVGSSSQIGPLREHGRYPEFGVRIIAGNGRGWDGKGESSAPRFPSQAGVSAQQLAAARLRFA